MPNGLQEFFKQLKTLWQGLSNAKRIALVSLTGVVLLGASLFPYLRGEARMSPLYANLGPEDAAKVVEKLEAAQIPYELRDQGTTVLVPDDRLYKLRLEMAAEGLPKGGSVGFELFDKSQFGATEFEQHVNLKRALEGELARSIATVDGVEAARVHLVLPRQSVFVARKESASASVVVRLKNPALFGKREVAAVVHLVAAAVPGLDRNHISVVSTEGLTLHRPNNSEAGGLGTEVLTEESQTVANTLESKALAQLERVVGPGGADVRVAVDLDSSTREETKETYQPDRTALRSEHTTSEDIRSQSPGATGIPGARSNLPDNDGNQATGTDAAQNLDTTNRSSSTRNWEVDRAVAKVHTPPGKVARLSVAVLLDGTWKKGPEGSEVFEPRSDLEVQKLTEVVKQAVGFDALRGDTISVSAVKFMRPELELDGNKETPVSWYQKPWALVAAAGLVAFALLLTVILVWRSSKKSKRLADATARAKLAELEEARMRVLASSGREDGAQDGSDKLLENFDPKRLPAGGPEAIAAIRQRALELAANDPSTTAVVLRAWLDEKNQSPAAAE